MPITNQVANSDLTRGNRLAIAIGVVLLLALAWFSYSPGLPGPFIFDDYSNTVNITPADGSWQELLAYSLSNDSGRLNRPISNLSFGLNYIAGGFTGQPQPYPYKVTNVVIHLVCTLLVFCFVGLLLGHLAPNQTRARVWGMALAAAALWALHPLQVSTVHYVVQRMTMLSALFSLVALIGYIKWRSAQPDCAEPDESRPAWFWLLTFLGGVGLSVFSKENGILVLVQVLLIEWLVFRRSPPTPTRRVNAVMAAFVVLPLLLLAAYIALSWDRSATAYALRPFDMGDRLLTQCLVLLHYLRLILFPVLNKMGLFQDDFPVLQDFSGVAILAIAGIVLLLFVAWIARRRAPVLTFAIAWFFGWHLLESTFIPLEMIFEHRNYLAMLGPMVGIAYGLLVVTEQIRKTERVRQIALLAAVALLATMTWMRSTYWSEFGYLVETMLRHHPESARVHQEAAVLAINSGNPQLAMTHADQAALHAPDDPSHVTLRLLVYCHRPHVEQWVLDESLKDVRAAKYPGQMPYSLARFANYKARALCPTVDSSFVFEILDAVLNNPAYALQPRHKTIILRSKTDLNIALGEFSEAVATMQQVVELEPDRPESHMDLARTLMIAQRFDEADDIIDSIETNQRWNFLPTRYLVPRMRQAVQERREAALNQEQPSSPDDAASEAASQETQDETVLTQPGDDS